MLEDVFTQLYAKFKLNSYRKIFSRMGNRDDALTSLETFCVELIHVMGGPTISEFARLAQISQANAAYKVARLIQKGYVTKERSRYDKREYHLKVTQKYLAYYGISYDYVKLVMERARRRFSPEELAKLEEFMEIISRELMPEIPLPDPFDRPVKTL